ncbi:phage head closure protein [Streptomyces shenzhenensis]|uniref:phage head closure protein n=1 Tax=Streptomyces shenzhenensis TaxID=943815 RepID=UPI003D8C3A2D
MDITHLLNRELEVWRTSRVPDGLGGWTTTTAPQGDVAAKVDQPSATERMLAAQAGSEHTHSVYVQPTADVRRGDELRGAGQAFRVLSVVEPSGPVYRKAECQLIQKEGA